MNTDAISDKTSWPSVSVVIPTNGQRDWLPAVVSALGQVEIDVEVLLVNNGPTRIDPIHELPALRILSSPSYMGANGARQLGIESSNNDFIALLDDDDAWLPNKLVEQMMFVQANIQDFKSKSWVCGVGQIISEEGKPDKHSPLAFSRPAVSDTASYLFLRKGLRSRLNQLQSSTLLFPRSVAMEVPFKAHLKLHQDWTWLLDVEDTLQAPVVVCPKYLVRYHKGAGPGITRSTRATQSLEWAALRLSSRSRRILGDFTLTVPFNMALESGALVGALSILFRALVSSRPGTPAVTRAVLALFRAALHKAVMKTNSVFGVLKK